MEQEGGTLVNERENSSIRLEGGDGWPCHSGDGPRRTPPGGLRDARIGDTRCFAGTGGGGLPTPIWTGRIKGGTAPDLVWGGPPQKLTELKLLPKNSRKIN